MTTPTDADARREFRLAALVMGALAVAFALIAGVAVAVATPEPEPAAAAVPSPVATIEPAPAVTSPPATVAPSSAAVDDPAAPLVVPVRLGEFSFAPKALEVPAGRLIRFEVTNPGALPHELLIGDRHAQDDAEKQMANGGASAASHSHGDEVPSLYLEAGGRGVLEVTFDEPAELLVGCHVPGHWAAGMRGTLSVSR